MEASAYYPGSIGELMQGNFKGTDILVSCPINLYTNIKVFESKFPCNKYKNNKTAKFLGNMLTRWGYERYDKIFDIEICSQIPRGKGFASSTADLCALYNALIALFNREFNQLELAEECINIEPTDSIIFKEMTLFDYKNGTFYESIGSYIEFYILIFEGFRIVDTVEFNKKSFQPLGNIDDLVPILKNGVLRKSIGEIGSVSSESIRRNQHRLKYNSLDYILGISRKSGGAGVIGAHSGDCLGIIFENEEQARYAKEHYLFYGNHRNYILKSIKI
ncbi:GHMP kinase protein [Clostridiales bacterium oral taxon 876 str. F0540]|nr:GHMP kinase protein [Clostridiales bacterium oral taxon 876 str. F0540]